MQQWIFRTAALVSLILASGARAHHGSSGSRLGSSLVRPVGGSRVSHSRGPSSLRSYPSWCSRCCWCSRYGCYAYYSPAGCCWYYWYPAQGCYYPLASIVQYPPAPVGDPGGMPLAASAGLPPGPVGSPVGPSGPVGPGDPPPVPNAP